MSRIHLLALLVIAGLAVPPVAVAQELPKNEAQKYYQLEFVVKEIENSKVVSSRSYTMSASNVSISVLRTGGRMPFTSGSGNINYLDIGVNIDVNHVKEAGNSLTFIVSSEISSIAPPPEGMTNAPPVVRQNRWNAPVTVPLRKPTLLFSSDDTASKRKMQLEVSVTPLG